MLLPRRGDPQSRLVIALVLFCRIAFWTGIVWIPLILAVFSLYAIPRAELAEWRQWLIPAVLVALSIAAAIIAAALAKGLGSGARIAYFLTFLAIAVQALMSVRMALTSSMAVLEISRATTLFPMAIVVAILTLRGAHENG